MYKRYDNTWEHPTSFRTYKFSQAQKYMFLLNIKYLRELEKEIIIYNFENRKWNQDITNNVCIELSINNMGGLEPVNVRRNLK